MNIAKMTSRTYVNEHQGRCQPNLLHGGQPVTVWAVGPEPVQRGGGRGLACLLFDVLEAAAYEQLRRIDVHLDAIEGARRGRRPGSGRAGRPAWGAGPVHQLKPIVREVATNNGGGIAQGGRRFNKEFGQAGRSRAPKKLTPGGSETAGSRSCTPLPARIDATPIFVQRRSCSRRLAALCTPSPGRCLATRPVAGLWAGSVNSGQNTRAPGCTARALAPALQV